MNVSGETLKGVQLTSLLNVAGTQNKGLQLAALGNIAVDNRGMQLGIRTMENRTTVCRQVWQMYLSKLQKVCNWVL